MERFFRIGFFLSSCLMLAKIARDRTYAGIFLKRGLAVETTSDVDTTDSTSRSGSSVATFVQRFLLPRATGVEGGSSLNIGQELGQTCESALCADVTSVLSLSRGTLVNSAVMWGAYPVSLLVTLIFLWGVFTDADGAGDLGSDSSLKRLFIVCLSTFFSATSVFHLAKLVRDIKKIISPLQRPFRCLVVGAFLLSTAVNFAVIGAADVTGRTEVRLFLLMGFFFQVGSCMNLVKLVRDKQEVLKADRQLLQEAAFLRKGAAV
ncbi:unnamed protein product [Amoebophrya sp. A25]|nr:unnamed protein product [Amoebophrya sp. A25]|eukprot:GSA25T00015163001.1